MCSTSREPLKIGKIGSLLSAPPHLSLLEKVLVPSTKSFKTLVFLYKQELTTSANRSKSCPYNPYAPMLANDSCSAMFRNRLIIQGTLSIIV